MYFSTLASFLAVAASSGLCYASPDYHAEDTTFDPVTPALLFNFTYLFTANVAVAAAGKPIVIPGGVRVIEQIVNGTVTGPAINATIGASLATPIVINNGTIQQPIIKVVGTTDHEVHFYLYETGTGSPSSQVTRIELEVAGGAEYAAALRDGYSRFGPGIC